MIKGVLNGVFAVSGLAIIFSALYLAAVQEPVQPPAKEEQKTAAAPVKVLTVLAETVPLSEVEKLNWILDKYRNADLEIVSNGVALKPHEMWLKAKAALVYTKADVSSAGEWIGEYCYRLTGGSVLYFKYPDGRLTPVRDVFLKELAILNQRI